MITVTMTKEEVIPLLKLYIAAAEAGLSFSLSDGVKINKAIKQIESMFVPIPYCGSVEKLKEWLNTQENA